MRGGSLHSLILALLCPVATAIAAEEPKHTNRLAKETSPYLLQHAHNPVDWYPWGEEALAKAKKEGKVIFLSVGYSSCHWCHVMERESFEDAEIAKFLNDNFVCIKVDREERPDIDAVYMTALQVYNQLAGSSRGGGWPLSIFLTPEAEPFVGGTYFPARDGDREGVSGFFQLSQKIQEIWAKEPERIRDDAKTVAKFTKDQMEKRAVVPTVPLDESLINRTLEALTEQYDPKYGGFGYSPDGRQPKFPQASKLVFLLDRAKRGNEQAKGMLVGTLEKISLGGIRDHIGGGFHRYSVDRYWRIPHFEKMLYDNGQLASVYAEAFGLTGREDFRRVVVELCDFVLSELSDPSGGFYAALDADSDGEEGKYYRWEKIEVKAAVSADEYSLFAKVYGLDRSPNFDEKFYVPQLAQPLSETAVELKMTEAALEAKLTPIRQKLLKVRNQRDRPKTDTKIVTADNGLMIGGLAEAGRVLKEPRYITAAEHAADFVLSKLRSADGRLMRSFAAGEARHNAYLNDYAYLTDGLIRLYRATNKQRWLDEAAALTTKQIERFADERGGGFYFTARDHEALLARGKEVVDGAVPAGNSVTAHNLIFLADAKSRPEYLSIARKTLSAVVGGIQNSPAAAPLAIAAIEALKP